MGYPYLFGFGRAVPKVGTSGTQHAWVEGRLLIAPGQQLKRLLPARQDALDQFRVRLHVKTLSSKRFYLKEPVIGRNATATREFRREMHVSIGLGTAGGIGKRALAAATHP
jgi:hypothetical protein